jgi:hypothetical protein
VLSLPFLLVVPLDRFIARAFAVSAFHVSHRPPPFYAVPISCRVFLRHVARRRWGRRGGVRAHGSPSAAMRGVKHVIKYQTK